MSVMDCAERVRFSTEERENLGMPASLGWLMRAMGPGDCPEWGTLKARPPSFVCDSYRLSYRLFFVVMNTPGETCRFLAARATPLISRLCWVAACMAWWNSCCLLSWLEIIECLRCSRVRDYCSLLVAVGAFACIYYPDSLLDLRIYPFKIDRISCFLPLCPLIV